MVVLVPLREGVKEGREGKRVVADRVGIAPGGGKNKEKVGGRAQGHCGAARAPPAHAHSCDSQRTCVTPVLLLMLLCSTASHTRARTRESSPLCPSLSSTLQPETQGISLDRSI